MKLNYIFEYGQYTGRRTRKNDNVKKDIDEHNGTATNAFIPSVGS